MHLKFILSKRKLIICWEIFFLIPFSFLSAQRTDIFSLETQYRNKPTPTSVIDLSKAYQEQADWFQHAPQFSIDSVNFYFDKAIALLENTKPLPFENLAEVYKNKSIFDFHIYKRIKAREDAAKAWDYFEKMSKAGKQNKQLQYDILANWSFSEIETGDPKSALAHFSKAQTLFQDNAQPIIQAQLLNDKGYFNTRYNNGIGGRDKGSLEPLLAAKQLYESFNNPKDSKILCGLYDNLSWHYNTLKNDSSYFYYAKMEALLPVLKDPILSSRFYVLKGNNLFRDEKYDEAKKITAIGLSISETYKLEYTSIYKFGLNVIGAIAQKHKQFDEAANYFIKSATLSKTSDNALRTSTFFELMSSLNEDKGDFAKALAFHKLFMDSTVANINKFSDDNLRKSELQLDILKKEKELVKKRSERNLFIGIIAISLLLLGMFAFFYDRERKRKAELEKQNHIIEQQAQALRQLDSAKTRFFANVSHELRTPLTLILAPLSSVLTSNTLDNKNTTLVSIAKQHARQLLSLANEILDLTKLESGNMTTHEEATDVYNFLRRLISTLESYAEQKQIKLIFDYNENAPRGLMLDKPKLEKIFNNLLSNALKFTPVCGTITVKVAHDISHWHLIVHDTGRGIHPDDLPHVFDRFYQTNQSNIPIEGGTGIGLALSKELAEVMGGTLSVESIVNEGATFMLTLPMKEVLGLPKELLNGFDETINDMAIQDELILPNVTTETEVEKNIKKTILVVEDNSSLRNYLQLILSDKYNVLTAENGQQALTILDNRLTDNGLTDNGLFNSKISKSDVSKSVVSKSTVNHPDLIISDIMMPVMDGFQLIEKIKADRRLSATPIVMLTARAETQDRIKALRIGVDDYLTKPFENEELFARIKNLLQNAEVRKQIKQEIQEENLQQKNQFSITNHQSPITNEDSEWLIALKNTAQKHIGDSTFNVEIFADLMHLGRSQFFRRVQLLTGLTPLQYIQEIRFNHARVLLERQSMSSVKAVAAAICIHKVQYFSEQFRERFGKSPSDYFS